MYLLFFVSRLRVEARSKSPVIYLRYKAATDGCEDVDFNEQLMNAFCFPLGADSVQPKEVQASEEYTFTLTHNDGRRFTGFCRQIFPPAPRVGSKARYPQVLCLVAENPWCNFFFKVLQVAEQILKGYEGLLDSPHPDLPLDSQLGSFLVDLRKQLATNPAPGEVLRLKVPNLHGLSGISPPRYLGAASSREALSWSEDHIELQVPPDCGNGKGNTGIPLARLLFHVPVEGMLTLVASLLLERRIVFVARSRDTVTAAVQAAQALIYPFKWHHIYLPLLPRGLVDYLSAPMPFLVGLTSEMLPLIRHLPMSEVTTVDLDLQKVFAPPGSQYDDGRALPYGRQLGAALDAVFRTVRSPTEYESSPLITGVMQEYFVRLFGPYRRFIHDQAMEPLLRSLPSMSTAGGAPLSSRGGGRDSTRGGGRDVRESRGGGSAHPAGGDCAPSPQTTSRLHDDMLRGHGYFFDQPGFVAHGRSETVRSFLTAMRHSQLYQMFIQERLEMAASGAIDLPTNSSQSFSHTSFTSGGRARSILNKSSSANNLTALDKAAAQLASANALGSSNLREHASANTSTSGRAFDSAVPEMGIPGGASPLLDPFEQRVQRYPEQRRLRREQLRTLAAETAPTAVSTGAGRLAGKLRRHRRTDSEDLHSQQSHVGGSFHGGESMRRITTYPGVLDVSTPSLNDPASYFLEWDLQEDDVEEDSASPSPSPRDRERLRSESGNSLQSADSSEAPGFSGMPPTGGTGSGAPGARTSAQREREGGRECDTPLRRLSVPMLATNAKSTYMSLKGTSSNDSPLALDRNGTAVAATSGPLPAAASSTGGAGTRMAAAVNQFFSSNGGSSVEAGGAGAVQKTGVQVKTLPDGHRVYDGPIKDIMRLAVTEAKNGLLSGLHGLASPLSSPRGPKEKESAAERRLRSQLQAQHQQQRQLLAAFAAASPHQTLQQQPPQPQSAAGGPSPHPPHGPSPLAYGSGAAPHTATVPLPGIGPEPPVPRTLREGSSDGSAAASGGGVSRPTFSSTSGMATVRPDDGQQPNRLSSLFSNIKDRVAGAGTKALGILPTPAYKPQTTGEKAAKFKAQLTGGGGASLLAGADGKLKQPHAPQRPLSLTGASLAPAWARAEGSESAAAGIVLPAPPPPTPVYRTPMASPAAPGTPSNLSGPVEVSPFAPRVQTRAPSASGASTSVSHAASGALLASGDTTPHAVSGVPGAAVSSQCLWQDSAAQVPTPSDWDPFGTASAPPAVGVSSASTWGGAPVSISAASTTTSPFAVTSRAFPALASAAGSGTAPHAPVCAIAQGATSSSCGASTVDLLGMAQSAQSVASSSFVAAVQAASSGITFDPFAASDQHVQSRLESAGSNDFAAFASASSPREFQGPFPLGSASLVG